jgi:hypothetical protein
MYETLVSTLTQAVILAAIAGAVYWWKGRKKD